MKDNPHCLVDDQVGSENRQSMGKDYMDLTMENGFVMIFGATNPLVMIFMLFNLQIMMNTDLMHMFSITRRPNPRIETSIGIFEYF